MLLFQKNNELSCFNPHILSRIIHNNNCKTLVQIKQFVYSFVYKLCLIKLAVRLTRAFKKVAERHGITCEVTFHQKVTF